MRYSEAHEFLKDKGAKKSQFEIVAFEELSNYSSKIFDIGKYSFDIPDDDNKAEILDGKLHYRTNEQGGASNFNQPRCLLPFLFVLV